MRKLAILTGLLLSSGCGQLASDPHLEVYCPTLSSYSDEFNEELAEELESLPSEYGRIPEAISGYVSLRDRLKACQQEALNLAD